MRLLRGALVSLVCLIAVAAQPQTGMPGPLATGIQLAKEGRYLEAQRILKTYADQNPDQPAAQAILGQLYYHFGYYAAALPVLQKAFSLQPADRQSHILVAVCLFKIGDNAKAEGVTQELLAEKPPPDDVDLSLSYAQYLYEKGDLDAALTQAQATVVFSPQHPIGFFWLARILQAKGETKQAAEAAERSVQLAPDLPYARNLLVRLYRRQGRVADATREADWLRDFEARKANP